MLIFESSVIMLTVMIMIYLKGRATAMRLVPVPSFVIYIITTAYMVFKVTWYAYGLVRYHQEKTVSEGVRRLIWFSQ